MYLKIIKLKIKLLNYNVKILNLNNDISLKENTIVENNKLIQIIKKEEEVLKIFEVYGKMIGKNGISKLVLSSER